MLNILLITFLLLFVFTIISSKKTEELSLQREDTLILRGIAILFIVLHHICQRVEVHSLLQLPFINLAYLFVGLFFFLSGYGNYISIGKTISVPYKWFIRRLQNLLFFFIAIFLLNFLINHNLYNNNYEIIKDFITFTYKPYTLWFFKVIFFLYIISFVLNAIPFTRCSLGKGDKQIISLFLIIFIYIFICAFNNIPSYWWNSVLAYPLGALYAEHHKRNKNKISIRIFIFALIFCLIFIVISYKIIYLQNIALFFFCLSVASYFDNFELRNNNLLHTGGVYFLGIYLSHPVFLTLFQNKMNIFYIPLAIILLAFVTAIILDYIYNKIFKKKKLATNK